MMASKLQGRQFVRLYVVGRAEKSPGVWWLCRCDCGEKRVISSSALISGNSKSCGCLASDLTKKRSYRHGKSKSDEHRIWAQMKARCDKPTNKLYSRYGGRGIAVCKEWKDFAVFYSDMGPRPTTKHSIERIDNDGNYEKQNCKWATREEQCANTSQNVRITVNGETKHISAWAKDPRCKVGPQAISKRLRRGLDSHAAVMSPPKQRQGRKALLSFTAQESDQ